jgi:AcrR family transcriptional regulator
MLQAAARLFAQKGFAGTSMEEIGAACGMSGPAVYKHFPSKGALLAQMLLDISRQLVAGSRVVITEARNANDALIALIEFHADFALNEPDLIRVQDRDLGSLNVEDNRQVRRQQREYVEIWVSILRQLDPDLSVETARVEAHAAFGLLNSTAHSQSGRSTRATLIQMASYALMASD